MESLLTISRDHGASGGDVQPLTLFLWIIDHWRRWNPEMTGCSVAEVVMREFWFFWGTGTPGLIDEYHILETVHSPPFLVENVDLDDLG